MMDSQEQLLFLLCLSLILVLLSAHILSIVEGQMGLQAEARRHPNHPSKKLFVFGDSYVDTGNTRRDLPGAWKDPYGITFPGKPAGRFSDGRVLTDFIAKYMGLKSPIPYKFRNLVHKQYLKYGMNFAVGGTGVFDTSSSGPNMTAQIISFNHLIQEKVYNASDLRNSMALVSVAGNDYFHYLTSNRPLLGLPIFIASVVNQTTTNLIRLQSLGVTKIVVGGLQPLGCLPETTAPTSFQSCNSIVNAAVDLHNILLNKSVTELNQETKKHTTFAILDLYDSFMSVLNHPSSNNIKDPLKPCCVGVSSDYFCGSVDENDVKKYVVCAKSAFFWDLFHPTQAGWNAVYNELKKRALHQLLY